MDARRFNDMLRLVGPVLSVLTELTNIVPEGKFKHFLAGACLVLSALGTRAVGTEYQSIADDKAIAKAVSMMPPPLPPSPPTLPKIPVPPPAG